MVRARDGARTGHKKKGMLPWAGTGTELESVMLSEISQRKADTV